MANANSFLPTGDHSAMIPPQFLSCTPLGGRVQESLQGSGEGRPMIGGSPAAGAGGWCTFTASQLEELHVQVLIHKHLVMGVPVPQELLLSVHRSLESMITRLYNPLPSPAVGHYSYFGKKFDPEPGRCRRTDGKKWRCSKSTYPDSKYCERHMHRGRTRSRKPVEPPPVPQAQSPTAAAAAAGLSVVDSLASLVNGGSRSLQMHSLVVNSQAPTSFSEPASFGMNMNMNSSREFSFLSESSTGSGGVVMGSNSNQDWGAMPLFLPLSTNMSNCPQPSPMDNIILGQAVANAEDHQDQVPYSFMGNYNNQLGAVSECSRRSLRPAGWPEEGSSSSSSSSSLNSELSISMPLAPSHHLPSSSSTTPSSYSGA